jgi:glyoxylase I family protein
MTEQMSAQPQGLHHIAFRVHDFDASMRFYTAGLGFTEKVLWGEGDKRTVLLDTGNGNYLEISAGGTSEAKPEGVLLHFALRTADTAAALQRALAAGAQPAMPPTNIDVQGRPFLLPIRIAFCKGPDGEMIEFFQNTLT